MFEPSYVVTSIVQSKRAAGSNRYTGAQDAEPMWRVELQHTHWATNSISLLFAAEEEADKFGLWEIYRPKEIMDLAGADTPFTVQNVAKTKHLGKINAYTDKPEVEEAWKAYLSSAMDDRQMEWMFPTENQARQKFQENKAYTLRDMLGTLLSVPTVVSVAYQFAAEQAAQRAKDAEAKKHEANVAAANAAKAREAEAAGKVTTTGKAAKQAGAAATQGWNAYNIAIADLQRINSLGIAPYLPPNPTQEQIQQAAAKFHAARLAAEARVNTTSQSAVHLEQVSSLKTQEWKLAEAAYNVAKENVKRAMTAVAQRTIPDGPQYYTISNGGASGYYNGVFYKAGTHPDGQWHGTFEAT